MKSRCYPTKDGFVIFNKVHIKPFKDFFSGRMSKFRSKYVLIKDFWRGNFEDKEYAGTYVVNKWGQNIEIYPGARWEKVLEAYKTFIQKER